MPDTKRPQIYNIPAGLSFIDVMAERLLADNAKAPEKLAEYLILLPTRRACRALQDGFLRQSKGKPILLPKLQAFGDIDADELLVKGQAEENFDIPPAMPPMKRQILLAKIISKLPKFSKNPAQDMALAQALGQLMDQIYTENLKLADLPNIVDREAFANHWQITLEFLNILSENWPLILKEQGVIDAADRRNRLLYALNKYWQTTPPNHPVIAAGTTGSIPATAALLKTILTLPCGSILLPGLDKNLSSAAWDDVEEGHPQATLKNLLSHLDCARDDVQNWVTANNNNENITREKIFSYVMMPPNQTDQWQKIHLTPTQKNDVELSLKDITRLDCATPQSEAQTIALILRETLEDETKIAALVTPDRNLARRVSMLCQRWGIEIDDSAGHGLTNSTIGQYIRLAATAAVQDIKPVSFLALLKHKYSAGAGFKNFRGTVRLLDKNLLRGTQSQSGFKFLKNRFDKMINDPDVYQKPDNEILDLLNHLEPILQPAINLFSHGTHRFKDLLKVHLELLENLATSENKNGAEILWQGEEGEVAANLLSQIYEYADDIPDLNGADYLSIIEQFMAGVSIRPRYGTHPRLMILGQLEARLIQADRVILSGLNEGIWPSTPPHDPWMSREMRKNFGLPLPERSTSLAAHDFVQGVCSREVFITRALRMDDAPSVPARWLQRLDSFLETIEINPESIRDKKYRNYLEQLDEVEEVQPIERPAPIPPASARPDRLSVTKIETWLKDPYAIYAREILKLKKIDPLEKDFDAAERGTILHEIMERFTKKYPKILPPSAEDDFIQIAEDVFHENTEDKTLLSFWKPRLIRLSKWVVQHEKQWRQSADFGMSEVKGALEIIEDLAKPFTLSVRADRIDYKHDGSAAIIDYKSGGAYSLTKMGSAELSQLPLEGMILEGGGFEKSGLLKKKTGSLSYWVLTGGKDAGKITDLNDDTKIEQSLEYTKHGLKQLIQTFDKENTPYMAIPRLDNAPRFNDYEHLERVREWAALGDNGDSEGGEA